MRKFVSSGSDRDNYCSTGIQLALSFVIRTSPSESHLPRNKVRIWNLGASCQI